jgi:hypothetical protein
MENNEDDPAAKPDVNAHPRAGSSASAKAGAPQSPTSFPGPGAPQFEFPQRVESGHSLKPPERRQVHQDPSFAGEPRNI